MSEAPGVPETTCHLGVLRHPELSLASGVWDDTRRAAWKFPHFKSMSVPITCVRFLGFLGWTAPEAGVTRCYKGEDRGSIGPLGLLYWEKPLTGHIGSPCHAPVTLQSKLNVINSVPFWQWQEINSYHVTTCILQFLPLLVHSDATRQSSIKPKYFYLFFLNNILRTACAKCYSRQEHYK